MKNFDQIYVENLLNKVERFYKRFYINKLVKGFFVSLGIILGVFLVFDLVFYYGSIPNWLRYSCFYGFFVLLALCVYFWIFIPLLRLVNIKKGLSIEDSSRYIGRYYGDIGDKLLNVIQLSGIKENNTLSLAAVSQHHVLFDNFDFEKAAPKVTSNKLIWVLVLPFVVLISLGLLNDKILTVGTQRFVNYKTDFSKIAPFTFHFDKNLSVLEGEDVALSVNITGSNIPHSLWVNVNGNRFKMMGESGRFSFTIKNVVTNFNFYFTDGIFESEVGLVDVNLTPKLNGVEIAIIYPEYLGMDNVSVRDANFMELPEGSAVSIKGVAENYESFVYYFNKEVLGSGWKTDLNTSFVVKNGVVKLFLGKENVLDVLVYECEFMVIGDELPVIDVDRQDFDVDELVMFSGRVSDDYGLKKLEALIFYGDSLVTSKIDVSSKALVSEFQFGLDYKKFNENITVQFVVTDNDKKRGFKSAYSNKFVIVGIGSLNQDSIRELEFSGFQKDLIILKEKSKAVTLELKDFENKMLNKDDLSWSDRERVKSVVNQKMDLQKKLASLEAKLKKLSENNETSELQRQKEKQLEDLLHKLLEDNDEELLKELLDKLNKLDKDELQKQLKDLQKEQEKYDEELQRDLEVFKQMRLEQLLEKNLEELAKLEKQQRELFSDSLEKNSALEDRMKAQKELNKKFEELTESLNELDSLNKELEDPKDMDLDKDSQEDIKKDMKESLDSGENGKKNDSKKSQKSAAEKMAELKKELDANLGGGGSQEGEDLDAMRKILENLLVVSFNQESVLEEVRVSDKTDPRVVLLNQNQLKLIDDFGLIKDSLYALSVRIPQIGKLVTEEIYLVNDNMRLSKDMLVERKLGESLRHQQMALTSVNNLAVLIDEIIQQMQEQQKKKGEGSCSKPGSGKPKPSLGDSKKKQNELSKEIKKMKDGLKKGEKPGKLNPGKLGEGMSMEVAKLSSQQSEIRKELRRLRDELAKEGDLSGAGELKKLEDLLEKNEEDLINLKLDHEFFERQADIEVKMLEAEEALRTREMEQKRESVSGNDYVKSTSSVLEDYLRLKQKELELLRLVNPTLNKYYKGKVNVYSF